MTIAEAKCRCGTGRLQAAMHHLFVFGFGDVIADLVAHGEQCQDQAGSRDRIQAAPNQGYDVPGVAIA